VIDALSLALTVLAAGTALAVLATAAGGRFRRSAFAPALSLLEAGLAVQAALDVIGLARGHRPGEQATHVAYLVASLVVVPLAALETRRADGGWSAALLAVALVAVAVLVIRMQTTWR